LRLLVDGVTDHAICMLSRDGTVASWNRGAERLYGYTAGEIAGRSYSAFFVEDDVTAGKPVEQLRRAAEDGHFETEAVRVRKDGSRFWAAVVISPLKDDDGRLRGFAKVARNVTLRKMDEGHEHIFEVSPVGMAIHALDGRFIDVNPSGLRLLGLRREEILGRTSTELGLRELESGEPPSVGARVEEHGSVRNEQRTIRTPSGEVRHLTVMVDRVELHRQPAFVTTFLDVTEQRRAREAEAKLQAQLIFAERMASLGALAAGTAHEINNPLTYVISNLDLLREEIRDFPGASLSKRLRALSELVDEAREGAERVRRIVRGLKTFSRADDEHRVTLDVRPTLDAAAKMAMNEIRHRARLVKDYGECPPVRADEARLAQVFINLLLNAAHAIPEGQADRNEIRLATTTDGAGRAVIEVGDTGPGMPHDVVGRIFDPFFTTKPPGMGTGLGLSICQRIVSALGGEITVQTALGRGTTFRVALPADDVAQTRPKDTPSATAPARTAQRGRVLVVDDDLLVRKAIGRTLGDHDVTLVGSAREGCRRIASGERYDVIFCDLMMPDMTGMDFHAALAECCPEQAERIVFVSGGTFTPNASEFLERVPNERIEKPFDQRAIRAAVRRFLQAPPGAKTTPRNCGGARA
jgi:PAS domain S-box-containing protein